ncbi:hypothetical protein M758_UG148000 [Ceratodon purpureus]|nr:hypothetical protein M758_UG148000 [Ceratodon purpureus]
MGYQLIQSKQSTYGLMLCLALLAEEKEPNLANATARGWPASVHIIGKDILGFHAVYWPAMLMSAGVPLPEAVFGHGFLTKDGLKMGKSLGNTFEHRDLMSRFGPDAVRYYFLKKTEFGKDGDFSEGRIIDIINAHLDNTIGNLLNRTLGLLKKNFDATIPSDSISIPEDNSMRDLGIAHAGNLYMNDKAPWSLFKQGGSAADYAAQGLTVILEAVRIMVVALSPVVPEVCSRIYSQLGYTEADFKSISWLQDWSELRKMQSKHREQDLGSDNLVRPYLMPLTATDNCSNINSSPI